MPSDRQELGDLTPVSVGGHGPTHGPAQAAASAPVAQRLARQPYHAPCVRRLGSVRDLTLGSAGATVDTRFSRKKP